MDSLPQELLDKVFEVLFDFDEPITARFDALKPSSRQAILNCRPVQRKW